MSKKKACKKCKSLFMGTKCPRCGSEESTDAYKGKLIVLNAEQSEIAQNMKIKEKGEYAIKA